MGVLVLSSMMGVGLLSMPSAFQRLGWLPGFTLTAFFTMASVSAWH